MAENVTKQDVQEIVNNTVTEIVDKAVADLSGIISDFAQQVDSRFNQVETRLDRVEMRLGNVEQRLETVEARLDALDAKYDHLLSTIDAFIARIDHYETEQAARDRQFERLLEWARKVSEKTGIPLENL